MRKVLGALVVILFVASLPAAAGEAGKEVELTGFITDAWCGKANANPQGAECARACAKKGSALGIYAKGKLYKLDDKELALQHIGYKVVVKGQLTSADVVEVSSITKLESKS